ncbi:MAG: GAF domain-containing protein [Caldilineaceae bacterium]
MGNIGVGIHDGGRANPEAGDRMHPATVQRPRHNPTVRGLLETGYEAMLSVPLIVKDDVYGSLVLYYETQRRFSPEEIGPGLDCGRPGRVGHRECSLARFQAERSAITAERNRTLRDPMIRSPRRSFRPPSSPRCCPSSGSAPDESNRRLEELRQLTRGVGGNAQLELRPATRSRWTWLELLRQLTEAATGRFRFPVKLRVESDCAPRRTSRSCFTTLPRRRSTMPNTAAPARPPSA